MATILDKSQRCSFCLKWQEQVEILIAGPGVNICNECVGLCEVVISNRRAEKKG